MGLGALRQSRRFAKYCQCSCLHMWLCVRDRFARCAMPYSLLITGYLRCLWRAGNRNLSPSVVYYFCYKSGEEDDYQGKDVVIRVGQNKRGLCVLSHLYERIPAGWENTVKAHACICGFVFEIDLHVMPCHIDFYREGYQ